MSEKATTKSRVDTDSGHRSSSMTSHETFRIGIDYYHQIDDDGRSHP
jgi:hypothetical protein